MKQIDNFFDYLQELDLSYSHLADLLRQKLVAVNAYDIKRLDEIMKEEQVYVLLARGFDSNLDTHREKLDLTGVTLGEVVEELPADERDRFRQQYKRLKTTLDEVKLINQKCQSALEDRLYSLDQSVKSLYKGENASYQKTGDVKAASSGPLINKSI